MKSYPAVCLGWLWLAAIAGGARTPAFAQAGFQTYFNYLGEYPAAAETGFHQNVQGVAHDATHWYITQTERVWRIPVGHDLISVSAGGPGITTRVLSDYPSLVAASWSHFGDPVWTSQLGNDYLLVPMEFATKGLAVLTGDASLSYVDHAFLSQNSDAPWCAVDGAGVLYSSDFHSTSTLFRYAVDWNLLDSSGVLAVSDLSPLTLRDAAGAPTTVDEVQGGEVSPDGQLLYLVADGIHVFDISTGRRVAQSTNGFGHFNYQFDAGEIPPEEPEGLTIWDLDDGRAPGISGQLHVFMLDNDVIQDDIYFKHYTNRIYVSASYSGPEKGTPAMPFDTVQEAYSLAWPGAVLAVGVGSFPESLTFTQRLLMESWGGPAVIGP